MSTATQRKKANRSRPPKTKTVEIQGPRLYRKQYDAIFDSARHCFIEASTKAGKAQPLDATIYTPDGPTTMGALKVGDRVCGVNGATTVLGIYPQGTMAVYRITFSDGATTEATADHLWEVRSPTGTIKVVTTNDLMAMSEATLRRTSIPLGVAEFESQALPLDPYLLGCLLGNGGMTKDVLTFSTADKALIDELSKRLPGDHEFRQPESWADHDWLIGLTKPYQQVDGSRIIPALKELGLWGKYSFKKSIPEIYRYNGHAERLEVVRGLLDTDGTVNKHGQPEFSTTSKQLALDMREVAESLGATVLWTEKIPKINGVEHRRCYTLTIRVPDAPNWFRLRRKADLARPSRRVARRMFRAIEYVRDAECQCIQVADERHLYLTDRFIATHNTVGCIVWQINECFTRVGHHWWVAPVYQQSKIAFTRALSYLPEAILKRVDNQALSIEFINGSVWTFKSGEKPDNLYGEDVLSVVIDEASRCREAVWVAIRSTLTATRGRTRVIGNVKGRKNWFFRLSQRARSTQGYAYHKLTAYDAVRGGVLAAEEIAEARRDLTDAVFRELYLAEPTEDGANPFGIKAINLCVKRHRASKVGPVVCWGIDLASKRDFTVLVGLDAAGNVARVHKIQRKWRQTIPYIRRVVGNTPALVDSTGVGDPVVEELCVPPSMTEVELSDGDLAAFIERSNFKGYVFTPKSKQQLMEGLQIDVDKQAFTMPEGFLAEEMRDFEFVYTRTGVKYSAPEGYHDDAVCALALARRLYKHVPSEDAGKWW